MGAVIVKRVRTTSAAALAAVVIADLASGIDSHGTKSASTSSLRSMAHTMADVFAVTLAVAAPEFGSAGTQDGALGQVAAVMRMVVLVLLADVDQAVVTAVVPIAIATVAAAGLRNGVAWTQLTARVAVVVNTATVMVVVRVFVNIRAADNIVVGFTGACIASGFINCY